MKKIVLNLTENACNLLSYRSGPETAMFILDKIVEAIDEGRGEIELKTEEDCPKVPEPYEPTEDAKVIDMAEWKREHGKT